ncbi:MAG: hypothetical protein ACTSRW_17200 [Candidatus Helarchaeota archaeon]
MVFQLVDYLTSTALWIVLIILLLGVCSVFFYIKSYKGEGIQKQIFFGYGLLRNNANLFLLGKHVP